MTNTTQAESTSHSLSRDICQPLEAAAPHQWQRYFVGNEAWHSHRVTPNGEHAGGVQVFRDAKQDVASLSLNAYSGSFDFSVAASFSPAALREIAARLLDAAHDIEQRPASSYLAREAA